MRFQHLKDPPIIHGKYKVIRHARFVDVLFLIAMRRIFPLLLFFQAWRNDSNLVFWKTRRGKDKEFRLLNYRKLLSLKGRNRTPLFPPILQPSSVPRLLSPSISSDQTPLTSYNCEPKPSQGYVVIPLSLSFSFRPFCLYSSHLSIVSFDREWLCSRVFYVRWIQYIRITVIANGFEIIVRRIKVFLLVSPNFVMIGYIYLFIYTDKSFLRK